MNGCEKPPPFCGATNECRESEGWLMFIWTIGDVIYIGVVLLVVIVYLTVRVPEYIEQLRCKHDGSVYETRACEAICLKCGLNLGFIGNWRKEGASRAVSDANSKEVK